MNDKGAPKTESSAYPASQHGRHSISERLKASNGKSELAGARRSDERGFVLAMVGLLIIPIVAFSAIAVDLSSWYTRGSELQKAVDAAALSGVVFLPSNPATAKSTALGTLARNDMQLGSDLEATVTVLPGNQLQVSIVDSDPTQFFSNLFYKDPKITRTAVAQYLQPIPIGSPDPTLGGDCSKYAGGEIPASACPGFWVNLHGPFSDTTKGDAYSSACYNGDNCNTTLGGTTPNPQYNGGAGYWYKVTVPTGYSGGAIDLEVFDAGYYPHTPESDGTGDHGYGSSDTSDNSNFNTTFLMIDKGGNPYDPSGNPVLTPSACGGSGILNTPRNGSWVLDRDASTANSNVFKDKWATLCQLSAPIPGATYYVHAFTSPLDGKTSGAGANRFALRAASASGGGSSVQVSGLYNVSIYNNLTGNAATSCTASTGFSCATFYLAKIDSAYAGKTIDVRMWDAGDLGGTGTGTLELHSSEDTMGLDSGNNGGTPKCTMDKRSNNQVISPLHSGNSVTCREKTYDSGSNPRNPYNGMWLDWHIELPTSYSCDPNTAYGCWWKVSYLIKNGVTANDTTTWEVTINGNPVHLVK